MPVDYGGNPVGSEDLRQRLEAFSQQFGGQTVRVLRGDQPAAPPVPPYPSAPAAPPAAQRRGCLGGLFGGVTPAPQPAMDPSVWQGRASGEMAHTEGLAADIVVDGLTTREVSEAAARSGLFSGVGHYDAGSAPFAHTHVDVAPGQDDGSPRLWMAAAAGALGAAAAGTLAWNYFEDQRRRAVGDS